MTVRRRNWVAEDRDEVGWIAYTDFFAALALVFAVTVGGLSVRAKSARVFGTVYASLPSDPSVDSLAGCRVVLRLASELPTERVTRTDSVGGYQFPFVKPRDWPPANDRDTVTVSAICVGRGSGQKTVEVDDTVKKLDLDLGDPDSVNDEDGSGTGPGGIILEPAGAEELFLTDSVRLKEDSYPLLRVRRNELRQALALGRDRVIAIVGHTDDQGYSLSRVSFEDWNNWMLGSQRAAAVATFMISDSADGGPLSGCQVVVMSFGPSRPRESIDVLNDSDSVLAAKRGANRRIAFQILEGGDIQRLGGGECATR